MAIRVEEYLREDGSNPYKRWFDALDARAAAKVTTAKLRMELGHTSNIKWFDGMGEYVIDQARALLAEYKARKKARDVKPSASNRKR